MLSAAVDGNGSLIVHLTAAMIGRAGCRLRCSAATCRQRFTRLLSSWRPPPLNPETPTASDEGSSAYSFSRKYARPPTVVFTDHLNNSACFIGTVLYPLMQYATRNPDKFGVYTLLCVQTSPRSHTSFRIHLEMWDKLAQIAQQHLKPNDYIYVSGQLAAFSKEDLQGVERVRYKVTARELNYVKRSESEENLQKTVKSQIEAGESPSEKNRNHLLMWQVFFANPSEWYDQRKTKKRQTQPDFMNKSSGEVLWLRPDDPPWVKKQLELLDSKFSGTMESETPKVVASRYLYD